ncbi:MAG: nucleoside deaminase [Acidimicrobiia bacterium]|nr:nucleoside deaminase [Acidimicrobiia bacterium]
MIVTLALPDWLDDAAATFDAYRTDTERMIGVIDLARRNVDEGTGGPFSAAIFDEGGRLIAAGVNVVVPTNAAIAHAEAMAVAAAGQALGSFDLGIRGPTSLFASTEPCVMCMGVTVWSGVSRLVCAGRDEDAREIGFDEGPKHPGWVAELTTRGISVERDLERHSSVEVLRHYLANGGDIYNAGESIEDGDDA